MAAKNLPYGASPRGGRVEFRVWAPKPRGITLHLLRSGHPPEDVPMQRDGQDFVVVAHAAPGDRYAYILEGSQPVPDPVSRFLPEGVHGPTEIIDPCAFRWSDEHWHGLELRDYVIYELHVGTFTPAGTFDGAAQKLTYLKELGITAVEVMPVGATPGVRNWGYDGVSPYSVQSNYGGPQAFKRFINAAHGVGLAVVLDVVYNHLGPEGDYLPMFGPYFTSRHQTPWGEAMNYDSPGCAGVRHYMVNNALYWIGEYHLDGLRLDAVQTIKDDSPKHILAEVQEHVQAFSKQQDRSVCIIAETDENDSRYTNSPLRGGYGLNGVWSDDFHHAVHAYLTGERQGYYQDFGKPAQIAQALSEGYVFQGEHFRFWNAARGTPAQDVPIPANIICTQNHDQVGNRAKGERLSALVPRGARKLATALLLLAPHTPLLFMGEEYDERAPFQFFADFQDPALKKAVRDGRRNEFKEFDFNQVPDPEDPRTFAWSRLTWAKDSENRDMLAWYQHLLQLRRQFVTAGDRRAHAQYTAGVLTMTVPAEKPYIFLQAALLPHTALPPAAESWREALRSDEDGYRTCVYVRRVDH